VDPGQRVPAALAKAEAELTEAIQKDPQNPEAFYDRAIVRFMARKYEKATDDFTQAIDLGLEKGRQSGVGEECSFVAYWVKPCACGQVIYCYNTAIEANRKNPNLYIHRGIAHYLESMLLSPARFRADAELAIADFTKAIELNPLDVAPYDYRARVMQRFFIGDRGLGDLTKVIELQPTSPRGYSRRFGWYAGEHPNDSAAGFPDLNKLIELEPANPYHHKTRADKYRLHDGDYERALADYTEFLRLAPGDPVQPEVLLSRALCYANLRRFNEALADCDRGRGSQFDALFQSVRNLCLGTGPHPGISPLGNAQTQPSNP
jgi:tetratricopeptide (TPR) repeat protein